MSKKIMFIIDHPNEKVNDKSVGQALGEEIITGQLQYEVICYCNNCGAKAPDEITYENNNGLCDFCFND